MGLEIEYLPGQTPLDPDEMDGLRLDAIATRGELDEWEQWNIEQAVQWSLRRSFRAEEVFTEDFIRALHRRMFGEVWSWAGKFRKSDKNIGVAWSQIPVALRCLLDDAIYWYKNSTYNPDELVLRFKHRLVAIHCFPNGNGRHGRLLADILNEKVFRQPQYSWGSACPDAPGVLRERYISAMKAADCGDIRPLIDFARS